MTVFGITGQRAANGAGWDSVRERIEGILDTNEGELVGFTCLAVGAETMFAEAVQARNGKLNVVIPGAGYTATFTGKDREVYERLRDAANLVFLLLNSELDGDAFLDTALEIADRSDVLIVVWDGQRSADGVPEQAVLYAEDIGVPVEMVWVGDFDL